jgi:hypothetical protein
MKYESKWVKPNGLFVATEGDSSGLHWPEGYENSGLLVYRRIAHKRGEAASIWQYAVNYYPGGSQFYACGTIEQLVEYLGEGAKKAERPEELRDDSKRKILALLKDAVLLDEPGDYSWYVKRKKVTK